MSFKRKNLYPKSTVDSNQPGTVPKIRISNSPSSNINTAKSLGGGGSNPIFAHGKMCVFPFFPMGKNGKKSIHFPLFPYTFFPFFPWEKWENTHFSMGKNGFGPPPLSLVANSTNKTTVA